MKTFRPALLVLLLLLSGISSCKKCTECTLVYDVPVGGVKTFTGESVCGSKEDLERHEAAFKNIYQSYGTVKCARN